MDPITHEKLLTTCVDFLHEIGIRTHYGKIETGDVLPGLCIQGGEIIIDKEQLTYPGDILHEAGHIAVVPANERATLDASTIELREQKDAEEMMAIAWSYAACIHLQIDPLFVFHDHGYQTGGSYIAENFNQKRYFGVPMLQWVGLTWDEKNAPLHQVQPYPYMVNWLRD
jgi:DNA-binding XRE family transcriptional regulator